MSHILLYYFHMQHVCPDSEVIYTYSLYEYDI